MFGLPIVSRQSFAVRQSIGNRVRLAGGLHTPSCDSFPENTGTKVCLLHKFIRRLNGYIYCKIIYYKTIYIVKKYR